MAPALVGTMGAVTVGAAAGAATPLWDSGASRTAGSLLVCWVGGGGGASAPATPAGWTGVGATNTNTLGTAIFYKNAAGADAAPTIAAMTANTWSVRVAEFSGIATSTPIDKSGSVGSGTTPLNLVASGIDTAVGQLVVYAIMSGLNGGTTTMTSSGNNWTPVDVNNNATNTANHYVFGYGITTVATVADKNTLAFDDSLNNANGSIASFKLGAAGPTSPLTYNRGTEVWPNVASAPTAVAGQTYFDSTTGQFMQYNGTVWRVVG